MKKIIFLLAVLVLAACTPADPVRDALEQYAKEHMENPASYKFANMSMPHNYTYMEDLITYKTGIEGLMAKAADKAPYEAELEKIDDLLFELGSEVACFDRTLYFWFTPEGSQAKFQQFVIGRFTPDGRVIARTMDPESLPTYPALGILKEQGRL